MFKHTAMHDGVEYKRSSKNRRYEFLLVGRRWNDVSRKYAGFSGRRSKIETVVNREAGIEDGWRELGWSRDRDTAEKRRQTELNAGYAEVVLVPAEIVEHEAKAPRRWQLRTYAAVTTREDGWGDNYRGVDDPGFLLRQLGKRARTFTDRAAAEEAGRAAFVAGEVDAWAVSEGHAPPVAVVVRGSGSDYHTSIRTWWEASHWGGVIDWQYAIDTRAGTRAKGHSPTLSRHNAASA